MITKTIDFPEISSEKIKVEIICNEFTIIKVEKLQTLKTTTTTYSDGRKYDDSKLKTETTIFLDNNEHFSLKRDVKILEGWHIRETYLVFNGQKCYHNSYCPEAKECLLGSPETIFSHFRKLRWHYLYRKQILEICTLDKFQNPKPELFFEKYSSELTKLKLIFGIILFAGEIFIFYFIGIATILIAIIFFITILLLSKITKAILRAILNPLRKKKFDELRKKEFDLPNIYKDFESEMSKAYDNFLNNGLETITQIESKQISKEQTK